MSELIVCTNAWVPEGPRLCARPAASRRTAAAPTGHDEIRG
ncbi:hypothetical protein [Asticcacaulis sp. AC402]|nr:hypothetical protein [Asticcacaulis sp. AC402]